MLRSSLTSLALFTSLAAAGLTLLAPSRAEAFCGFYVAGADAKLFNDATVVVLMRYGTRTVLSMQNAYQGPPEAFALVIPVPVVLREQDVETLRPELFDRVDKLAAPRLVEYWEMDPCETSGGLGLIGTGRGGGGHGTGSVGLVGLGSSSVTVEAEFAVGEYEIVILSATESNGLDTWLRDNGYNIPAGAEPLLRPYVEQGSKFFVAKVDPAKVKFSGEGQAMLSPLRFHYDSDEFALPVRLGLINAPDPASGAKQDLLIHILAPETRYAVANYPNVTIPTNLDLQDHTKQQFGEFYVSLFDHTLAQNPGAVVTEYAWGAGSCDPCPGEDATLTEQELLELGADVLPDGAAEVTVGGPIPVVRTSAPTVGGPLDKDLVRRIVRAHNNEVRSCYQAGLARKPELAGRVEITFTIDASGTVTTSKVGSSTLDDERTEGCVAKAVRRWKFPKPQSGGGPVTVNYPFELAQTPDASRRVSASLANAFVLTRLHARYDASSLGEDLVFEAAEAISGGREVMGEDGQLERGATPQSFNSFQARYAIRHAWAGEIACKEPIRGRWSGPPDGERSGPTVARALPRVARDAPLGSFITESASARLGSVAVIASPEPETPATKPAKPPQQDVASAPNKPASCTCTTSAEPSGPALAWLGLLALLGLRRRRPSVI